MTNELPELPEAAAYFEPHNPFRDDAFSWPGSGRLPYHTDCLYTAEQMQAYARAAVEQAGGGEVRLWDSQWVQVVNHADCYAGWTVEDAVHHAVKMTERLIAENVAAGKCPPTASAGVTEAMVEQIIRRVEREVGQDGMDGEQWDRVLVRAALSAAKGEV